MLFCTFFIAQKITYNIKTGIYVYVSMMHVDSPFIIHIQDEVGICGLKCALNTLEFIL